MAQAITSALALLSATILLFVDPNSVSEVNTTRWLPGNIRNTLKNPSPDEAFHEAWKSNSSQKEETLDRLDSRRGLGGAELFESCVWSYCAGRLYGGQTICDEYKGIYINQVNRSGCGVTSSRVQCCYPKKNRVWTPCITMFHSSHVECNVVGGKFTGNFVMCPGGITGKMECQT